MSTILGAGSAVGVEILFAWRRSRVSYRRHRSIPCSVPEERCFGECCVSGTSMLQEIDWYAFPSSFTNPCISRPNSQRLVRGHCSREHFSLMRLVFTTYNTYKRPFALPIFTLARLQNDPPSGVTGAPMDTNIMLWQAVIFGPDDTPWEGGTFKLVLEFTEDYPNKAPQVRFVSRMFHPNIYADGQICLDILQNQWSPIYDISAILTSIQSLLCDPNPASPANSEASRLYNENRREYNRRVREIVEQSWVDES